MVSDLLITTSTTLGITSTKEILVCALRLVRLFFFNLFLFIYSIGYTSPLSELNSHIYCGDADLSYYVNILDASAVSRWSAYGGPMSGYIDTIEEATAACYNADTNFDFGTTILDSLNIARYVVGLRQLQCNDITYRCAPFIYGGPFGGYQETNFAQCLALFRDPATSAGFTFTDFEATFCDPNRNCGRGPGESESPCVPLTWVSAQDVLNTVRPGYSFIGPLGETSCRALDAFTEIPVGTCFQGQLGVTPLSGINSANMPVSDKDCDTWSDAIENCIDSHIQTPGYFNQFVYTAPEFSCFYDENPGVGSNRNFIICHD